MQVCGSRARRRNVYLSETNRLEVVIMSSKLDDEPVYFLLNYEGIILSLRCLGLDLPKTTILSAFLCSRTVLLKPCKKAACSSSSLCLVVLTVNFSTFISTNYAD